MSRPPDPIAKPAEPMATGWSLGRRAAAPLAVFVVAVVMRLVVHAQMVAAADTFAPTGDSDTAMLQALRVAAGHDITDGVTFERPLYPWMLGLMLRATGVPGAMSAQTVDDVPAGILAAALRVARTLNFALGVLTVLLIAALARRACGDRAGLVAGLLAAIYGPFLFYEGLATKDTLTLVVLPLAGLAAAAALRAQARREEGGSLWLACGVALGAGGLVLGEFLAVGWLTALVVLLRGGTDHVLRQGLRDALALAMGLLVVLVPVVLRNSVVAGRPVLATAAGGAAFYACNLPGNATGLLPYGVIDRSEPRHPEQDWSLEAQAQAGMPLAAGQVSEYWLRSAVVGIARDPGTWLLSETRKVFLLASRYEAPQDVLPALGEREVPILKWTPSRYSVVFPLAVGGLFLAWIRRQRGVRAGAGSVVVVLLCASAVLLLVFSPTSRYRLPVVTLLLVYAGYLLTQLPSLWVRGSREGLKVGAAVVAGLLLSRVSESPLGPLSDKSMAGDRVVALSNRAQIAAARGRLEAAQDDLQAASDEATAAGIEAPGVHATLARLHRLIARDLLAGDTAAQGHGQELLDRSAQEIARALELDAEHGAAWKERGLLFYDTARDDEAIEALTRARGHEPKDREVLMHLALAHLRAGRAAQAEEPARALVDLDAHADDGWGLLTLALLRQAREKEAKEALVRYDTEARARESHGLPRRLPEMPDFAALRTGP